VVAIARFTLPRGSFPFDRLFDRLPEATVELERVVPLGNAVVPYFWVTSDADAGLAALPSPAESEADLTVVAETGGQSLVRLTWTGDHALLDALVDADVTLLSAVGRADGWLLELRADDRASLARFDEACVAAGLAVDLVEIHALTATGGPDGGGLTAPQAEALGLAYRRGYYDEPRTATLADLAAELDVSRQAVSGRLRRGTRRLIEDALVE
jgi:predicted DNA binding protein